MPTILRDTPVEAKMVGESSQAGAKSDYPRSNAWLLYVCTRSKILVPGRGASKQAGEFGRPNQIAARHVTIYRRINYII